MPSNEPRQPGASDDLSAWCRATCLDLPGATTDQPFGAGAEAFRVHTKMFALLTRSPAISDAMIVNLKADPDEIPLLVGHHDFIIPGYHMSKKHWVSIILRPGLDRALVGELVEDSYDSVVLGLPTRLRTSLDWGRGRSA